MEGIKNCPYCTNAIEVDSEDHIFSGFLGGKQTIPACKQCNNDVFGRGFEGRISKNIHIWHTIISNWGIKLKTGIPTWKNAQTDKGGLNIEVTDKGVEAIHAKPIIKKSKDGKFESGTFRTRREAERHHKSLIAKGVSGEIEEDLGTLEAYQVKYSFEFTRDLFRLALKMCSGLFTLLPDFNFEELNTARTFLTGEKKEGAVSNIQYSFDTFEEVNSKRPPFSHTIYVERTKNGNFGLVQFFGVFQFICKLGNTESEKEDCALLAFLDPITGEEKFEDLAPIPLNGLPGVLSKEDREQHIINWIAQLNIEAQKRDGKDSNTAIYGFRYE